MPSMSLVVPKRWRMLLDGGSMDYSQSFRENAAIRVCASSSAA